MSMAIVAARISLNVRSVMTPVDAAAATPTLTEMFPRRLELNLSLLDAERESIGLSTMAVRHTGSDERTLLENESSARTIV